MDARCRYYAHSTRRPDRADWQPLRAHLENDFAELAAVDAHRLAARDERQHQLAGAVDAR